MILAPSSLTRSSAGTGRSTIAIMIRCAGSDAESAFFGSSDGQHSVLLEAARSCGLSCPTDPRCRSARRPRSHESIASAPAPAPSAVAMLPAPLEPRRCSKASPAMLLISMATVMALHASGRGGIGFGSGKGAIGTSMVSMSVSASAAVGQWQDQ